MKKVGIIGGSGFIGSHITKLFLEHHFEVKSSTTAISNKHKYQHLMELKNSENLHICELDVLNKQQLIQFVSDCDIVIHSGTPFQLDFKDAKIELYYPTIKGTAHILDVANNIPSVKKVVIIASVAAYNTNFPLPAEGKLITERFSENDTPFTSEESHPYAQAKFMAHQIVNTFIKTHPDSDTEIVSVSPVMVMGKSLSNRVDPSSTSLQYLFKNKIAPNPFIQMFYDKDIDIAIVSVKDVAYSVFKAAIISGLHGNNYLLSSESYPISDVSLMLNNKPPKHSPKIIYQNQLAEQQLGVPFRSVKSTLNEFTS